MQATRIWPLAPRLLYHLSFNYAMSIFTNCAISFLSGMTRKAHFNAWFLQFPLTLLAEILSLRNTEPAFDYSKVYFLYYQNEKQPRSSSLLHDCIFVSYLSKTSSPKRTFAYSLMASTHFSNPSLLLSRHKS